MWFFAERFRFSFGLWTLCPPGPKPLSPCWTSAAGTFPKILGVLGALAVVLGTALEFGWLCALGVPSDCRIGHLGQAPWCPWPRWQGAHRASGRGAGPGGAHVGVDVAVWCWCSVHSARDGTSEPRPSCVLSRIPEYRTCGRLDCMLM